jgi:hypothetical protein
VCFVSKVGVSRADLPVLDRAEQGEEFVELDLGDAHVVQDILGKGLEMLRGLHQPLQHRVRVDLEHPRHGTDAQACRERAYRPYQQVG